MVIVVTAIQTFSLVNKFPMKNKNLSQFKLLFVYLKVFGAEEYESNRSSAVEATES